MIQLFLKIVTRSLEKFFFRNFTPTFTFPHIQEHFRVHFRELFDNKLLDKTKILRGFIPEHKRLILLVCRDFDTD